MRQLFDAVYYCHQNGIIHRNITLENVYIDKNKVTLIDFEQSKTHPDDKNLKKKDAVSEYTAPEFLNGTYDEKCDVWSLGVLMYTLISGHSPFKGDSKYVQLTYQVNLRQTNRN